MGLLKKLLGGGKSADNIVNKGFELFDDVTFTKQEQAEQNAKEEREKEAAREYQIHIENKDSGHTKYIITVNQTTLSETIYEITPLQTKTLNLFRGSEFQIKYYYQDWKKDDALLVSKVNETFHNNKYTIS